MLPGPHDRKSRSAVLRHRPTESPDLASPKPSPCVRPPSHAPLNRRYSRLAHSTSSNGKASSLKEAVGRWTRETQPFAVPTNPLPRPRGSGGRILPARDRFFDEIGARVVFGDGRHSLTETEQRMSVDKMLQQIVADEIAQALRPVHDALAELQGNGAIIARLAAALGQPVKRGPGRPPKTAFSPTPVRAGAKRGRKPGEKRDCAIIGCRKAARSKGYCSAHYQKFRMLDRTGRLPSDWVADAAPNSVKNIALPRGRAGAKALAAGKRT